MNNRIVFTNNTGYDIRDFDSVFIKCVLENLPLPEEIAEIDRKYYMIN